MNEKMDTTMILKTLSFLQISTQNQTNYQLKKKADYINTFNIIWSSSPNIESFLMFSTVELLFACYSCLKVHQYPLCSLFIVPLMDDAYFSQSPERSNIFNIPIDTQTSWLAQFLVLGKTRVNQKSCKY